MSIRSANQSDYLPAERDYDDAETPSLIDRHSSFDGTFRSDRDLRVEGEVKGSIVCQGLVFVAQGSTVEATVHAENITVAGDLTGEVACRGRLQLMPSGRLRGKVSTASLVIEEGAFYEGQLEMTGMGEAAKSGRGIGISAPVPISAASEARGGQGAATTFIRRLGGQETAWDVAEDEQGDAATGAGQEGSPSQ